MRNVASWMAALAVAGIGCVAHADAVKFKNELADCAAVRINNISTEANVVLAHATVSLECAGPR